MIGTAGRSFTSPGTSTLAEDAERILEISPDSTKESLSTRRAVFINENATEAATPAELKAMNREGFFDNYVRLTGTAGTPRYKVDKDDVIEAVKLPIRYELNGMTKYIYATSTRGPFINLIYRNIEEGLKVCVTGTIGRPSYGANFTIHLKHIKMFKES